jgi:MYND finger
MPSSKKERGRRRLAAKAANRKSTLAATVAPSLASPSPAVLLAKALEASQCSHGSSHDSSMSLAADSALDFVKQFSAFMKGQAGLTLSPQHFKQMIRENSCNIIPELVARGVAVLTTSPLTFSSMKNINDLLIGVMIVENFSTPNDIDDFGKGGVRSFLKETRNLSEGGLRQAVQFFSKRATCDCLVEMAKQEKQNEKLGRCHSCHTTLYYRAMLVCSDCRLSHYCSEKCQVDHWQRHKLVCQKLSKGDASALDYFLPVANKPYDRW